MSVSSDDFKIAMRRLAASVTVVTTGIKTDAGAAWSGLTATAVCSLSTDPPKLLACINKSGVTFTALQQSKNMCVNLLDDTQKDIALRFAGMMQETETDRFDPALWTLGASGAPILKEALVSFDCVIDDIFDGGTHAIVIGNVKKIQMQADKSSPLLYKDGQWGKVDLC